MPTGGFELNTYKFSFNTSYISKLREAINDRLQVSIEKQHSMGENKQGTYFAWDRICVILDRISDTIDYINEMELGKRRDRRGAFDFYDFINNAYVIIDCIKAIGRIFNMDPMLIHDIEKSNEIFKEPLPGVKNDGQFFAYIRSLCSVHPACTNNRNRYTFIKAGQMHCCPFVDWNKGTFHSEDNADLVALIYTSEKDKLGILLGLHVGQFEEYLSKWINLIPAIIKAKNDYADSEYQKLRHVPVKHCDAFDNVVEYLQYLKEEHCKRFDDCYGYIFDTYARVFNMRLSDRENLPILEKYQNAILYALEFERNAMQSMSYDGEANTGIRYPDSGHETTLFIELSSFSPFHSAFEKYNYYLGKLYSLDSEEEYDYFDRYLVRGALGSMKEQINQYVHFTNNESDEEAALLVRLAMYLESLTRNCLINRNIPNRIDYRVNVFPEHEYAKLVFESQCNHPSKEINIIDDI